MQLCRILSDNKTLHRGPSWPWPDIRRLAPSAAVATQDDVGCKLCIKCEIFVETTEHAAPESNSTVGVNETGDKDKVGFSGIITATVGGELELCLDVSSHFEVSESSSSPPQRCVFCCC